MGIDKIIDELYDILDNSWHLPLSGGKVIVDSKQIRCLLEDMRLKLPKEIIQARNVVADRSKIIDDARAESENLMRVSENKIREMVNQSEIVKNAQMVADKIVSDAKVSSKEIKIAASQYVAGVMKDAEKMLTAGLNEIKKARQAINANTNGSDGKN